MFRTHFLSYKPKNTGVSNTMRTLKYYITKKKRREGR